jgi:excisionase family DNA binding protein
MPDIKLSTDSLLNFSEAARLLKVTRVTIYAMINRGELHVVAIADRRYLLKEEVLTLQMARAPTKVEALNSTGGER